MALKSKRGGDGRQLDTGTLKAGWSLARVRALGSDGSVRTIKLRVIVA